IDDYVSNSLGSDRLRGVVLMSFAAIGLMLATVGLYGVTASLVEERTREVGVRLVFGATPRQVWTLVVSDAARMVAWGAGAGALAAVGVGAALRSVVTDLSWDDAWSAVPAIAALALAALVAATVPALRAARSDPKVALT
ncbi:MAG TPA: FtsX-like permease family protein, partial [Vicinamibacterales bacterium]|nr:FtsX-like permease family protein [Vicinamibacterales bacterium]